MPGDAPPVLALVPMKPLDDAKSRLGAEVPPPVRQGAVALMLDRVVRAAVGALGSDGCRVIGGDELVRRMVEQAGGEWQAEQGHDLNSSLWLAMQEAYAEGRKATLFLPSDLPEATSEDILELVTGSEDFRRPVGVAARRDGGTNALLVPARIAFAPLLGLDSFARHQEAARAQGTPLVEVDARSLAFDVDTAADLEWARAHVPGFDDGLGEWEERLRTVSAKNTVARRWT